MTYISVIVPVYNAENFLTESINSILNQTLTDIEIICVNDGSTDNSLTMLKNMRKKNSCMKIINKENGGCGSARNAGLNHAKGEYVYFFDPDDYLAKNALEKFYYNAKNNCSDMVLSKIAWHWEGESVRFDKPGFNLDEIFTDVDFDNFIFDYKSVKNYVLNSYFAPWMKLYKTEFLKENNFQFQENISFDDVPFHIQTILKAKKISFIPEAFCYYRVTNDNSVNNTSTNSADIFRICDIIEEFLEENKLLSEFELEFMNFKITQYLLYIISSNSEFYYKFVKYEFLKMNITNKKLPEKIIHQFNQVINSKNYEEYRKMCGEEPLKNSISKLSREVDILKKENTSQKEEITRLSNKNKVLSKENDELINKYDKIRTENYKLKKTVEKLFSSKSWTLTKPLRKITGLLQNRK